MAADPSARRNSNTQLLDELEALSQSLYQSHTAATNRRTASLALPRTSVPAIPGADEIAPIKNVERSSSRPRTRRMSLSPWRSRPKLEDDSEESQDRDRRRAKVSSQRDVKKLDEKVSDTSEKKGIWNWKPIRALSHIGMQKLSCLFSVEVVAAQGLPASMNGLRLSVCVRKKETKDGAVHTMPSRVSQGAADFEETLFVRCHVYCTPGNGKQMKFDPRPFWIFLFAVDAEELDFGRSSVDLTRLIQESIDKSREATRIRQWDTTFSLSGKAKGGELVLKLGFQIMEKDGGIGIYSQAEGSKVDRSKNLSSSSFGRKQSKTSFSIPSPRLQSRSETWTPAQARGIVDVRGMDDLNLDEPVPAPSASSSVQKSEEPEAKVEDLDMPDFEVVDRGVEVQDKEEVSVAESEGTAEEKSVSSEVVKEVVHDQVHFSRLTELDSIAQQIKALESMFSDEKILKLEDDMESQRLDEDEENVTKEFLQMLEDEEANDYNFNNVEIPPLQLEGGEDASEADSKVYLPDLGKGLGCVVQTRNGGYLAAMNPLDTAVSRKDTPKLAMQLSKPLVLPSKDTVKGFELFQRMATIGFDELSSRLLSLMPMDELMGKTAEQVAFEGIASAIVQGRNKEGASSSAARTIAAVKTMATSMTNGRNERITTGLWNVSENTLAVEEILAFSMQKLEAMTIDALKIQADMTEDETPFQVSPLQEKGQVHPLESAVPLEDWLKSSNPSTGPATITIAVIVQLRDPLRRYEVVGGPELAFIHATRVEIVKGECRYKVTSMHLGGLRGRRKRNSWDGEKQRLTAMQWLVAYGLGKSGKKIKQTPSAGNDVLWSISSRVMAEMWLKPMRNPDVKFAK